MRVSSSGQKSKRRTRAGPGPCRDPSRASVNRCASLRVYAARLFPLSRIPSSFFSPDRKPLLDSNVSRQVNTVYIRTFFRSDPPREERDLDPTGSRICIGRKQWRRGKRLIARCNVIRGNDKSCSLDSSYFGTLSTIFDCYQVRDDRLCVQSVVSPS